VCCEVAIGRLRPDAMPIKSAYQLGYDARDIPPVKHGRKDSS
jgi:hypothetical protein